MGHRKQDERISRSVGMLISVLVRYPEVGAVKFEPQQQTLHITMLLTGELTDSDWERTHKGLLDMLEVYHLLEQREPTVLDLSRESYGDLTALVITRDARSFTPEEIYTIVEFFRERFVGRMVTEQIDFAAEDEMLAQDEMIQEIMAEFEGGRGARNLIAIREDGKVMVFQK